MAEKKSYTVYLRYLVTVEVEAESHDEAYGLATEAGLEQGDYELLDVTVENPN